MDAVRDVNPYYVDMLSWTVDHGIVKAAPKKPLSNLAHESISKVFQHLGGNYVSHAGQAWFELVVLEERGSLLADNSKIPQGTARLTSPLQGSALLQVDTQLASLVRAAQKCLEEV